MGKPHPETPSTLVSAGAATRIVSAMLAVLLAVTMLPAVGLQAAFADELIERPATSGGDVALESTNGDASEAQAAPVAEAREGGMLAADGLMYAVAEGGLALVGFDGEAVPEGALVVPAAVFVDGTETPVVAVDLAEGQVADAVTILALPQGVKDVNTASLAPSFPSLASVEIASAASSLPVATGAASVRATYSTSGGMIFRPTTIAVQNDDGTIESIECKELVWAPPALVSARIPVECRAVAEGAFASVRDLKTVVAFGTMERISDGAFSVEQMESAKVVVPASSPAVTDAERVSASMALMGDAGQKERRSAWHEAGWRTDDIVMGKPYGSLTETVAVTEEGAIERTEVQLVSYPGAHENAMDLKKPNADGVVEQAESGLAFTVKSDMTVAVTWQGDKTATPAHIDIPASVVIDNVTYPVTEIASSAFEGAVFLASVAIPEGVTAIGQDAFKDCPNLAEPVLPSTLKGMAETTSNDALTSMTSETNHPAPPQIPSSLTELGYSEENPPLPSGDATSQQALGIGEDNLVSPYVTSIKTMTLYVTPALARKLVAVNNNTYNVTYGVVNDSILNVTYTGGESEISWYPITFDGQLEIYVNSRNGARAGYIYLTAPSGYSFISCERDGASSGTEVAGRGDICFAVLARTQVLGGASLLTTSSFAGTGSALTAARSDHNHDSAYYKKAETYTKTESNNLLNAKVNASDFGIISYGGLDGSDASVYPTSYRKGGTPALPEPKKEGNRFTGWSWSRGGASGDSSNIADAFAEAGTVTLTANWEESAPEGNCFFADAALDSTASGAWESVIAVKLTDDTSKTSVSGIVLVPNDSTGLLKKTQDGALPDVRFALGGSPSSLTTTVGFNGAQTSSIGLVDVDGGKGIYVKITIPANGIDANRVVGMQTAESYIASLARMTYASIA